MLKISWQQGLAWRMERHLLDPIGTLSVPRIVRRLCGVQTQVASSAELAINVRRTSPRRGDVARALSDGRIIKTWAMRGALHLLTPEDAGAFLSLLASGRSWERPSWQRYFGVTPEMMAVMRKAVMGALSKGPLTREELVAKLVRRRELKHLGEELRSGWGTVLKPLAWQGDLCFGPSKGGRVTFMRPADASARWSGIPEIEDAVKTAVTAYFGAYAPTTIDAFGAWLAGGRFGKRQLRAWVEVLGDRLAQIEVDGDSAYVLVEHVDGLASSKPSTAVRLLPGFDQYVLGPGTADGRVVSPARRGAVSKQSGWISPVVVARGVVSGTWAFDGDHIGIVWFEEAGRLPRKTLTAEVARLSSILNRDLDASFEVG